MKGVLGCDADWNVGVLFIRSKSNPSLYLLDKRDRFRLQAEKAAVSFDSITLVNELLRIDLYSFFTEMASWHLYYRKCRPLYVLPNADGVNRHPLRINSYDRSVFHKYKPCWKRYESTPYIDSVDGFCFQKITFRNLDEYSRWLKAQPPVSPDFDTAISKALSRSSRGHISTCTKELLAHVCSVCLRCNSSYIPDPLYYSYLFSTIAVECTKINELLALVCSNNNLIKQYDAADLFNSCLHLDKHVSEQEVTCIPFELTEEPEITSYRPNWSFANFFSGNASPYLASHELKYLESLYAVSLQTCLSIVKTSRSSLTENIFHSLEEQLIQSYIGISNTEITAIPRQLGIVINLISQLLCSLTKSRAYERDVDTLTDLLSELRSLQSTYFFHSLSKKSNDSFKKPPEGASEEDLSSYQAFIHRYGLLRQTAHNKSQGPFVRKAALNDHDAALKQIKRQAIIRHAENTCLLETEWSFSKFYARLLSELLHCDKTPIRCKSCGSLFFPTGSNNQYCDRFDPTTNLYCSPRLNEKQRLGRKTPHGTAINLHKKAETAKQLNEKRRHAYFAELEEFVDHEIGPVYFKSTLITDELYQSWRAAINGPKNQPSTKTPEHLAFPHPVIWEDRVIDGNQEIVVYLNRYAYPALRDKLNQSAESAKSSCMAIDKPTILFGGWILRLFDLLRFIASINNDKEHIQDGPIPVPGLGSMDALTPDRSPLDSWLEGKKRLLIFPPSGKGRLILFEIIDGERSKQLRQDLTHAAPRPQSEGQQRQYSQERQQQGPTDSFSQFLLSKKEIGESLLPPF